MVAENKSTKIDVPICLQITSLTVMRQVTSTGWIARCNSHCFPRNVYGFSVPIVLTLFLMFPLLFRSLFAILCCGISSLSLPPRFSLLFFMAPVLQGRVTAAQNNDSSYKSRVTIVGSGNWGSVAAKLIASNMTDLDLNNLI